MIQRRPFGRTGHASSVMLFGAAALARASQDDADRALETLLRHGVNYIDRAARYGGSELRIGPPPWRKAPAAGRTVKAFNPGARSDSQLCVALMSREHAVHGFANRDLRAKLAGRLSDHPK
mgnify:CR=1